MTKLRRFCYKR